MSKFEFTPLVGEVFAARGNEEMVNGGDTVIIRNRDTHVVLRTVPMTDQLREALPRQYEKHIMGLIGHGAFVGHRTRDISEVVDSNRKYSGV